MRTYGLRFDVNCSILFTELPLLKRPGAARAAGFGAVEFWWPFTDPVPADREVDAFTGALAVAWAEGRDLVEAVRWANAAGAACVRKVGASNALPSRAEIDALYAQTY